MNIALTGPYGSGKSSIIRTFLKGYGRPYLQISLAAFLPEAQAVTEVDSGKQEEPPAEPTASSNASKSNGGTVGRQEIERSILQQMLYGADARRLPLSRFKRIETPGPWSVLASLSMIVGAIACWHLFRNRDAVMTGTYFLPIALGNWFNLATFLIAGGFVWKLAHHLYVASFGISLKSISLKDIEITSKAVSEESILNRHMDEIIYFFQSTPYDLVIIEDLDRFNNPDIFVTLREINSLVNANLAGKRHIRFLYALRDDMFVNTDRTKFFEIIIPVIPIVNSSNAIDMVLEQVKRLSIGGQLDVQFLREVSRYLHDLRLILNIFNEYAIYVKVLETSGENNLDANKLLAVLIYKNVFPRDFEVLHRGKGNLANVLRSHDAAIVRIEARYRAEIADLEQLIEHGIRELSADLVELRRIYAMALIEMVPEPFNRIGLNSSAPVSFSALANHEQFEAILNARQVTIASPQHGSRNLQIGDLQSKVDPHRTFAQRKEDVERKSAAFRETSQKQIRDLRGKLGVVRMMKFNETLREIQEEIDPLFDAFGAAAELARFLVLEGYLDDTYYQYTSLFHSGRLSPNDNKFLILIRSYRTPEPDFQIDNTQEVIAAMRDEDFSRDHVLNVTIVDYLLGEPEVYATQIKRLLTFIASDFSRCENFLASYYARGTAIPALISGLANVWPGFSSAALESSANLMHVAQIIGQLPASGLRHLGHRDQALTDFVSDRLPDILAQGIDVPPEQFTSLDIEVRDLAALEKHSGIMRLVFNEGLYELSIANLEFISWTILGIDDQERVHRQNYTTLLEARSGPLLKVIDERFDEYLRKVLNQLPDNRYESVDAMLQIIERNDLEHDAIVEFLDRQVVLLPSLNDVPETLQVAVLDLEKIEATWDNCLSFLDSDAFDATVLTRFLNNEGSMRALAPHPLPGGKPGEALRKFIIENAELKDEAYATYVQSLSDRLNAFPGQLSAEKLAILVEHDAVTFSADSLSQLGDDPALGAAFVVRNITAFLEVEGDCALDDDFRQILLEAAISDEHRLRIIRTMDLRLLADMASRAALVGMIIARTGVKVENLDANSAGAVIVSTRPLATQITLLNMLHDQFDDQQLRDLLQSLPAPLSEIKPGFGTPRLDSNDTNLEFVTWLKKRGFISSWTQGAYFDKSIRMNMFRK
ncbi:ATP-binding protein [Novosphingobium profundi]|nr:ATP-binding protein [Novosphingobium profundi]